MASGVFLKSIPATFRLTGSQSAARRNRLDCGYPLRHGDPATKPLWNITEEYYAKPGLTDLMRAQHRAAIEVMFRC